MPLEWGNMIQSRALLIVVIVLLLPVLYVGSYLALVVPFQTGGAYGFSYPIVEGTDSHIWLSKFYYPLERIDLAIRPDSWSWEQTH